MLARSERLTAAVRNNVHWYEALCEAHGIPGERHPSHWIHRGRVPPYMSNLVTTAGVDAAQAQLDAIASLIAADGAKGFSVKDGFQCLDLIPLGFRVLFRATWLFLPASTAASAVERDALPASSS